MKSGLKYIQEAIQSEIKKLLKEDDTTTATNGSAANAAAAANPIQSQDDIDAERDTFKKMDDFVNDETKSSDTSIKNSMKLMSALQEPARKNVENMNIKIQKDRMKKLADMKKSVETQQKSFEDNLKTQMAATQKQTTNLSERIQIKPTPNVISLPMITRSFVAEENQGLPTTQPEQQLTAPKEAYLVKFDQKTDRPYSVKFTERGFLIEGTRLSFETLENALSKNYVITLKNGNGLALNAIRMQQILKYKDRFFNGQQ